MHYVLYILIGLIILIVFLDLNQKSDIVRRNFPLVGNLRHVFIALGPPIRQYFIASNRDELPFNRSQRKWINSSAKKINNYER